MQLNFGQHMKMSQQMKLAPRMIQSMEILQLPIMALQERIDQELAENVVLELQTRDPEATSDTEVEVERERAREEADGNDIDRKELVVDDEHNNERDFERLIEMAEQWPEDNIGAGSRLSSNRVDEAMERSHDQMANVVERQHSLQEYLLEQFAVLDHTPAIRAFGEYLIQNLDSDGRLQSSLAEIVQVYGRSITMEDAEHALGMIQSLDPPGVGARDLSECLLLQIRPELEYREVIVALVRDHLENLYQNRLPAIEKATGYSIDEIKAAMEEMKHALDPHPGRGFEERPVQRVTPDVSVDRDGDGPWQVKLEDEYTPSLRISRRYIQMLRNNPDRETKEYIKKKVESAKWLIESIEQRNNTLKRVSQAIVD
ncbi:MAG: RNA polymerase sigma-54 factor, partial [Planctomycetes bacterium]|nr:RNA polymerase sigma-54 factor [Planctomycetota bacterium]